MIYDTIKSPKLGIWKHYFSKMIATKKFLQLAILIGITLNVSSCSMFDTDKHECPPLETTTRKFLESDRARIPYKTGTDTLTFVQLPSNIEYHFYGLGILNGFSQVQYSRDIECPNDIANCEYQTYKYESLTINDPIYIAFYIPGRYDGTHANFRFKTKVFESGMGRLGSTVDYNSLEIQGTTHNNIYRISGSDNVYDTTSYLLYTNIDGIIKIKFSNQDYWELKKK